MRANAPRRFRHCRHFLLKSPECEFTQPDQSRHRTSQQGSTSLIGLSLENGYHEYESSGRRKLNHSIYDVADIIIGICMDIVTCIETKQMFVGKRELSG